MIFQKIKKLFQSTPKTNKETTETFHFHFIDALSFQDADISCEIVDITENISMSTVRLFPPGTHNKMMLGKPFKIENAKWAILEISTDAKYDFKETGNWSKWPDPRTLHYSELKNNDEYPLNASSEVPCQFLLLESPALVEIAFENELVYNFFRNKLLNKLVKTGDTIVLKITGYNLLFYVGYAYPEEFVRIDGNTHISFIISSNQTTRLYPTFFSNKYTERIYPLPPEEFMPKIPSRYKDVVQGGHNKQYLTAIPVDLAYNKQYLTTII